MYLSERATAGSIGLFGITGGGAFQRWYASEHAAVVVRQLQHRPVLDTLITSVENEGSAESTAKLLRCHPNTIRYRLRRLHELTGRYCWTRRVSRNWRLPPMH